MRNGMPQRWRKPCAIRTTTTRSRRPADHARSARARCARSAADVQRDEAHRVGMALIGACSRRSHFLPVCQVTPAETRYRRPATRAPVSGRCASPAAAPAHRPPRRRSRTARRRRPRRVRAPPRARRTASTPRPAACRARVSTRLRRPGNGRPIDSKVRRPISTGLPSVTRLEVLEIVGQVPRQRRRRGR